MGNRLHPLLLNNNQYSYLNNSFSPGSSIILNSDLNFLSFIKNFFNNLNLNLHSFFLKRIDSNIYLFFYFYSNKQIKVKNKYISNIFLSKRKKRISYKKKTIFSKLSLRKKNYLDLYFFLLSFSFYYYNTKKIYLSLINLNYFKGFYFKENKKNKYNNLNKFYLKRNRKTFLHLKYHLKNNILKLYNLKHYRLLLNYSYIRQNNFFYKSRFIYKKAFNLPSYLRGFDLLLFHSFLYQSSKILGFYLKNLIELNFHTQKGLRKNRILYFFKRFFYSFIRLNKEKNYFFRKFSSFLILKGKFKKDGRKKKKIIKFDFAVKKQKKDSFIDYYTQDIFTRFGSLNLILYLKGQSFNYNFPSNFFIKSRFSNKNSSLLNLLKKNKAFRLLFYFIFVLYHAKFIPKIQSSKKKKEKRKNQFIKIRK